MMALFITSILAISSIAVNIFQFHRSRKQGLRVDLFSVCNPTCKKRQQCKGLHFRFRASAPKETRIDEIGLTSDHRFGFRRRGGWTERFEFGAAVDRNGETILFEIDRRTWEEFNGKEVLLRAKTDRGHVYYSQPFLVPEAD